MTDDNDFKMWVIYDHPKDHPGKFVARLFIWDKPTDNMKTADSIEEIRQLLPEGLFPTDRFVFDDPCIREVWF